VLGYTLPEMIKEAFRKNISLTVSNFESLSSLIKAKVKIKIHVKVDTGMNRHGFFVEDIPKVLEILASNNLSAGQAGNIIVEGLYTHFSMAKDPASPDYTNSQVEKFEKWCVAFSEVGYSPICHASATSGTLLFNKAHYDMVRIGIGQYGIWPSEESAKFFEGKILLKPVLSWKTIIAEIKKISKGSRVGYDGTNTVLRDTKLAVLPIGYWHGYPRALSNTGYVLINGLEAKILGRVCMDIIMVDITDIENVKVGDEVVLIGKSKNTEITADEISKLLGGSTYELLTRINPLMKRFYI